MAIVAMAVGDGEDDVVRAGPGPGPEGMRILAGFAGAAMGCSDSATPERPAERRFPDGPDCARKTHQAHQKTSRPVDPAGNGSGSGKATLGSSGPEPPIRL